MYHNFLSESTVGSLFIQFKAGWNNWTATPPLSLLRPPTGTKAMIWFLRMPARVNIRVNGENKIYSYGVSYKTCATLFSKFSEQSSGKGKIR